MGVLIGSAVVPIASCLLWSKCTAKAAITGAISGQIVAIIVWLVFTRFTEGAITIETTGAYPSNGWCAWHPYFFIGGHPDHAGPHPRSKPIS